MGYKYIQNNDPYTLVRDFVKYLLEISKAGARKLSEKFAWVERALEEHLSKTELRQGKYTVKQIEKMEKNFVGGSVKCLLSVSIRQLTILSYVESIFFRPF